MCSPDAFIGPGDEAECTCPPAGQPLGTLPPVLDIDCPQHGTIRITRTSLVPPPQQGSCDHPLDGHTTHGEIRAGGGCACPPDHIDTACLTHGYYRVVRPYSGDPPTPARPAHAGDLALPTPLPEQVPVTYHKGSTSQRIGTAHLTQDRRGIYAHIELDHQGLDIISAEDMSLSLHPRTLAEQMTYLADQLEQGTPPVIVSAALRVCAEMHAQHMRDHEASASKHKQDEHKEDHE